MGSDRCHGSSATVSYMFLAMIRIDLDGNGSTKSRHPAPVGVVGASGRYYLANTEI